MSAGSVLLAIPYASALALFCAELGGWFKLRRVSVPQIREGCWIFGIAVTYATQLAMVRYGALNGAPALPQWRLEMPIPVVWLFTAHSDVIDVAMLCCGAAQTYALIALYRSKPSMRAVAIGAAIIVAMSLAAPALTSGDVYSNAGYGLLGTVASYAPPARAFGGTFSAINRWWGVPMVASPYGPLWLAIDRFITAPWPSLLEKILALRVFGALCFVALAALFRGSGLPSRIVAITLLNPFLAFQFVANAHNDIFALAAIAAAAALTRARAGTSALLLFTVGLVKLPYVVLALPILNRVRPVLWRSALALSAVALTVAVSWLAGGRAYVRALLAHASPMESLVLWHAFADVVALAIVVSALFTGRRYLTAVWLLPAIGGFSPAFVFPWYLAWGLPYALSRHRALGYLLIWLPFISALVDQQAIHLWRILFVFPLVVVLALRAGADRRLATAT